MGALVFGAWLTGGGMGFRRWEVKPWVGVVLGLQGLGNTVGWVVFGFGIRDKSERERDDEVEREWSEMEV